MSAPCPIDRSRAVLDYLNEERWSNAACCGYLMLACEQLGYGEQQIRQLIGALENAFDAITVDQAKRKYYAC